jgi:outer membrane protein
MKHIFFLFLIGFSSALYAQEPTQWDLKSCVEYAVQHNISVQQADVQARLAKLQAELAKSNQLPTLNGSTGMGLRLGRSIDPTTNGFTNTQFLYNNFGVSGGVQIQRPIN